MGRKEKPRTLEEQRRLTASIGRGGSEEVGTGGSIAGGTKGSGDFGVTKFGRMEFELALILRGVTGELLLLLTVVASSHSPIWVVRLLPSSGSALIGTSFSFSGDFLA